MTKNKAIELRQENKSLKDSLTFLRTNKNNVSNERTQAITKDTTQKEKK